MFLVVLFLWGIWKAVNQGTGSSKHPCSGTRYKRGFSACLYQLLNTLFFCKFLSCCPAVVHSCVCKGLYINILFRLYPWLLILSVNVERKGVSGFYPSFRISLSPCPFVLALHTSISLFKSDSTKPETTAICLIIFLP